MFKLKLAKTTDRLSKGVLFHSTMTDNTFVIYSEDPNISDTELKKLAYKAFDILMGEDPDTRGLDSDECFDKYEEFLKQNKLAEVDEESGSLYEVTRKDLIDDLEWELGLDEDDIEPSMIDESKIGWYAYGVKLDIIDRHSDRF